MLQTLRRICNNEGIEMVTNHQIEQTILYLMRMKENELVLFSKNFLNSFFLLMIRKQKKVLFHCILSAVLVHRICLEGTIK